jgi:hypothetical protein
MELLGRRQLLASTSGVPLVLYTTLYCLCGATVFAVPNLAERPAGAASAGTTTTLVSPPAPGLAVGPPTRAAPATLSVVGLQLRG